MTTDFLSTLNEKQLEAVNYVGGPCLIIAGAGTGKTRTLTCKIAKLIADGVNPSRILAVTFTNKAAKEMRERIFNLVPNGANRVWIHTFHSFAVRILRKHAESAGLMPDFGIYDDSEQKKLITLCLEEMGVKDAKKEVNYYATIISRAKDEMISPDDFLQQAQVQAQTFGSDKRLLIAEVYKRYQRKIEASGALDFGDLLFKLVLFTFNIVYNNIFRKYILNVSI